MSSSKTFKPLIPQARKTKKPFTMYYGVNPPDAIRAIARDTTIPINKKGVCVELYHGYEPIQNKCNLIESLGMKVMVDNSSFKYSQQCSAFNKKGKMSPQDYFNYYNAEKHFDRIVNDYEKTLKNSKNSRNIVVIVPELIGSGEITQRLQEKYVKTYKDFQKKYGCEVWISLQFNPNSKEWRKEAQDSARFIRGLNVPKSWKIGVPYGKDFKMLWGYKDSPEKNRDLFNTIKRELRGHNVHLYGCGTLDKIKTGVIPHRDIINSVDASSVLYWSKSSSRQPS